MKITWHQYDLELRHAFTISRSSRTVSPTVIVELEHDGLIGYGEAAPSSRYGEDTATVESFFHRTDLSRFTDPFEIEGVLAYVGAIAPGNSAAKAAIDIALHDWIGKKLDVPLWKFLGLSKTDTPLTSFTIGIDSPEIIEQKVHEADQYPILKVKVGVPKDDEIITAIRKMTDKPIRADANEGWKSREQALEKILWLEGNGVEFVEQPMPDAQIADIAWLKERVHIPLIADESVKSLRDIPRIAYAFHGINIKLMKSTGIREAIRMIHAARAMGLKVMLGCMIENSAGIAAAANLSPLADYADLDGNLLITNDAFTGLAMKGGKILLNDCAGLGITKKSH